jgi:hypothetical protein
LLVTNVADVASIALSDLTAATVSLGNPVVGARNEWYINPTLFHGKIRDLANASGGNTISHLGDALRPTLLGYPVNFVNTLPGASASAAGSLLAVFGDVSLACYFGERRGLNFRTLNELYANTDQVGIQCTQRVALKVHHWLIMKVRFKTARLGFEAGSVVEANSFDSGLLKTLFDFNVLEKVEEDGDKLDSNAGDEPVKPSSKPKRSKRSPKAK